MKTIFNRPILSFHALVTLAVLFAPFSEADDGAGSGNLDGEVRSKACKDLVLKRIPGGPFIQGSSKGSHYCGPPHRVRVDSFMMGKHEVSWAQFCRVYNWALDNRLIAITEKEFWGHLKGVEPKTFRVLVNTQGQQQVLFRFPGYGRFPMISGKTGFEIRKGWDRHPAVNVTWYGAVAFCSFLSMMEEKPVCTSFDDWRCDFDCMGYRLPTESEWEKAAKGGLEGKMYPWGDRIHGGMANYHESGDPAEQIAKRGSLYAKTTPVGYYDGNQVPKGPDTANGYGLYDVAGNVWEWCYDHTLRDYDARTRILHDPINEVPPGKTRWGAVAKGGGYASSAEQCAVFMRSGSDTSSTSNCGFRVALSL